MSGVSESNPLAEYLARLRANLEGLPAGERDEAYLELTEHVKALVADALAAGGDRDEAVRTALKKFGDPAKIAWKVVGDYWQRNLSYRQALLHPRSFVRMASRNGMGAVFGAMLLTGPVCGVCFGLVNMTITSILDCVVLGAICGIPMGLAQGWVWSIIMVRYPDVAPKLPRRKRWVMDHIALVLTIVVFVLLSAIACVLESHLASDKKRILILNVAMALSVVVYGCVSQRFFFRRLKKAQNI